MTVPFLYRHKQVAVYHRKYFGANGLKYKVVYMMKRYLGAGGVK